MMSAGITAGAQAQTASNATPRADVPTKAATDAAALAAGDAQAKPRGEAPAKAGTVRPAQAGRDAQSKPGTVGADPQAKRASDFDKLDSPFASFRLGVIVSPVASIDTGLDVTFPRLRLGPSWATRFDLDLSAHFASASFGSRRDAEAAVSLCQVYTPGGINRGRFFAGAGIGNSFGPHTGLSGKVFAGYNFTPVLSVQAEAQFPPNAPIRPALMLRLAAL